MQKEILMADHRFDPEKVQELYAQGTSQRAIAKMFGVPKTTMAKYLKSLSASPPPPQPTVTAQHSSNVHDSTPHVHTGIPEEMAHDLRELVTWWRHRQDTLKAQSNPQRETERITFHVEKQWVEAIRCRADLDRLTITEVVNQAFRQFFTHKCS
jgi:hypothetical protein